MATAGAVSTDITSATTIANTILQTIEAVDPAAELPAAEAGTVIDLTADLVTAALTAYGNASGTPINATTIAALMPNPTPLSAPTV
jgi:hypothetical protein